MWSSCFDLSCKTAIITQLVTQGRAPVKAISGWFSAQLWGAAVDRDPITSHLSCARVCLVFRDQKGLAGHAYYQFIISQT
jgi:hypothetical protein